MGSERVGYEMCKLPGIYECKPLYFKGTEGVVELTQWFERMETVFRISNCSDGKTDQISLTCTLLAGALTWWNTHVMTVTHDVAYSMTWVDLMKKDDLGMFPEEADKIEKVCRGLPGLVHETSWLQSQRTMQEAIGNGHSVDGHESPVPWRKEKWKTRGSL
ncbi:hypothetical protein Tco_1055261 [Tanacetum coccineum]|uniref:Retrotransposon gag domain-containing protein n=1 Tax=Tanacetum coccineum TaxID=301880 RepID=A0ABQ5GZG7_9ASTR